MILESAPKKELVISRYKENVSWVSKIQDNFKVLIYNKFEGENLLPNVGREPYTYLMHIINHYDNLADYTVFCQGHPFDHCPNFLSDIRKNEDFLFLGEQRICDLNGKPKATVEGRYVPVGLHWEWLTNQESPQTFIFGCGAQFIVSKRKIRERSKDFYIRAIKSVEYSIHPIEAFCFEREWGELFGISTNLNPKSLDYSSDGNYFRESFDVEKNSLRKLGNLGWNAIPFFENNYWK